MTASNALLGQGVYSLSEAARLASLPTETARRWLFGYRNHAGIVNPDLPQPDNRRAVSFLALVELCLMGELRAKGFPAQKFREAAEYLVHRGTMHPFAHQDIRLQYDNKRIFVDEGGDSVTQVTKPHQGNLVMRTVVAPYFRRLDFARNGYAERLHPLGRRVPIVVDPAVLLGQPVVAGTSVPTTAIMDQLKYSDVAETAAWYGLPRQQVEAARRFEERLVA